MPARLSRVHQAPSWRADEFKRNLDSLGVPGGRADLLDLPRGEFRRRGASRAPADTGQSQDRPTRAAP